MSLTQHLAKHLRDVHFGPAWAVSSMKDHLADVTWQQATAKIDSFNTIVALVYHINYYVAAVAKVLGGGPLDAHDKYSFDHPPITSEQEWRALVETAFADAETLASLVEAMPEKQLWETFVMEKYGNYYRNIEGVLEHTHYHLGQIVLIKKMVMNAGAGA